MKSWKRLLFYLVLNILVSACTTLAVLFVWDQFSGPMPRNLLPKALSGLSLAPTTVAQPAAQGSQIARPTPTEEFIVYQIKAGDTFESLAEKYNLSVDELISVNGFTRSQPLGEGEVLRIPVTPRGSVAIDSVVGAGDLESERVLLKHQGAGELSLVGWRLEDGQGNIFIFPQFPQLMLYKGGAVNVHTAVGANTVVDLYWGLSAPVWKTGVTVTLKDPQGNIRATYIVP
jgi:LysM repeat protein